MKISIRSYDDVIYSGFSGYGDRIQEGIKNALNQLETNYSGDTYICDAISEVADYNVSIWNGEVLRQAENLNDDVAEAVREGLVNVDSKDFDLIKILQCTWYMVNERGCYDGLSTVAYNYMAGFLNDADADFTGDIDDLENALWDEAQDADNNMTYYELEEKAVCVLAVWLGLDGVADMRNPAQGLCSLLDAQKEAEEEAKENGEKYAPQNVFTRLDRD